MGEIKLTEDDQFFKFKRQNKALLFIDGNYMINISRILSIKIDMENLFDELSKEFFRQKTYWYSALESNLDRSNNTFRFLDRLHYIPRTKVYIGRLTRNTQGHFLSALKTDAGIALSVGMVEQAMLKECDYILLVAGDPQYIPAVRTAQRYGCIVRLIVPKELGDLRPHHELVKVADEKFEMDSDFLYGFEYMTESQYYEEEDKEDIVLLSDEDESEDPTVVIPTEKKDDDQKQSETLEAQIENGD